MKERFLFKSLFFSIAKNVLPLNDIGENNQKAINFTLILGRNQFDVSIVFFLYSPGISIQGLINIIRYIWTFHIFYSPPQKHSTGLQRQF